MHEQKVREHDKAYDQQQKQLTALKKGGKSGKQAIEEVKGKMKAKAKKGKKGAEADGKFPDSLEPFLEEETQTELLKKHKAYNVKFVFPPTTPLNPPILGLHGECGGQVLTGFGADVTFGFGEETLFEELDFGVDMSSRIAIVGPNGVGKSTLMKLLYGKITPVSVTCSALLPCRYMGRCASTGS